MKKLTLIFLFFSGFYALTQPKPKVTQGHNFQLSSLSISADGKRIVSTAGDKKLIFWDTQLGKEIYVLSEGSTGFANASVAPSGKFFSAFYQGQFWVWDAKSKNPIYVMKPKEQFSDIGITGLLLDDERAVVFIDGSLKIINFKTKQVLFDTPKSGKYPYKIWHDPTRDLICTFGFSDQILRVYNSKNLSSAFEIDTKMQEVINLSIHPKDNKIIVAGNELKAKEFDFKGNLLQEIGHKEAFFMPICFYNNESIMGISHNKLFDWNESGCDVKEFEFQAIIASNVSNQNQIAIGGWDFSIGLLNFSSNNFENLTIDMSHCEGLQTADNSVLYKGRDGLVRQINFDNILSPEVFDFNRSDEFESVQTLGNLNTFYCNEKYVYSANKNELILKNRQTHEDLKSFKISDPVTSICGIKNIIYDVVSEYSGSQISILNLSTKIRTPFLFLPDKSVVQLLSKNEKELLIVCSGSSFEEGYIYTVDQNAVIIDSIEIGNNAITDAKYYSEQNYLLYATGGFTQNVIGLNLSTGKEFFKSSGRVAALNPKNSVVAFYKNRIGEYSAEITIQKIDGSGTSHFSAHESIISHLAFSEDGRYLISTSWDKSMKIWDWENEEHLLTIYYNAESDNYHILTPESYYYSSKDEVDDIYFVEDGAIGLFKQYDIYLNRPDKVLKSLAESDTTLINFFHKAYLKRLERLGIKDNVLDKQLNFVQVPEIRQEQISETEIKFFYEHPSLQFKQNGVLLNQNQLKYSNDNKSVSIQLTNGENQFEIYSQDDNGIRSKSFYTKITSLTPDKTNLYLITLGASEFVQDDFNLKYASKDAQDIEEYFESNWTQGEFEKLSLLNKDFVAQNLTEIEKFCAQSSANDIILVFISSHGVLDAEYNYYLASHDMDFKNPAELGISLKSLEEVLAKSASKRKVVFIDACHSGEFDKDEIISVESEDELVEDVTFRGFTNYNSMVSLSAFDVSKELFTDFSSESGISFISSASGFEFALEGDDWKNGVFTYALLEGLKNRSADNNLDGQITLSELEKYIYKVVPILTKGKQQPNSRVKNPYLDFIIQEKD